jgi:hypothetical protein
VLWNYAATFLQIGVKNLTYFICLVLFISCSKDQSIGEVEESRKTPKFFKHQVNDVDSIDFYCAQMGYDGIEFDLNFFPELAVFHHDTSLAQPFELFADAIRKNKKLNYWIDLSHNKDLNKDNINNLFNHLLDMLPRTPKNCFFETSDSLAAQYLQQRGYQVVYWIQPFLALNDSLAMARLNGSKFFGISFARNMYEQACEYFADLSKFVFIDDVLSIDDTFERENNIPTILQDTAVKAVLLDDLHPPKLRINKIRQNKR